MSQVTQKSPKTRQLKLKKKRGITKSEQNKIVPIQFKESDTPYYMRALKEAMQPKNKIDPFFMQYT